MARADPIQVDGLRSLQAALKAVEKGAPREAGKAIRKALEPVELVASSRTPTDTGLLQRSNRVTVRGVSKVAIVNKQPYANAIHWGRKRNRGVPSVIKARPFIYDTVQEQREVIGRTVIREIELFISRELP